MEKYEKIINLLNIPLIPEENINYSNHLIFKKYTSQIYYKYAFDLLDTLTKKQIMKIKNDFFTILLSI